MNESIRIVENSLLKSSGIGPAVAGQIPLPSLNRSDSLLNQDLLKFVIDAG